MSTSSLPRVAVAGEEQGPLWRQLDYILVLAVLVVSVFGIAMIYSSSRGPDPANFIRLYSDRQAIFLGLGMVAMLAVALVPYDRIRLFAWMPYALGTLVLILVVSPLGATRRGAQAWFQVGSFQIQPSEFMKVAFIVALAALLSSSGISSGWLGFENRAGQTFGVPKLAGALVLVLIPIGLVLLEPDAGTSVVFVVIATAMIIVGGVRIRHALALLLVAAVAVGLLLSSTFLEEYQQERLVVFINPGTETVDTYNVEQAQIAIGNGGFLGQGYGQGSQTQSGRVPEQHTDFIFTAIGEELGFLGATATVLMFGVLLWRIWRIANASATSYGRLVATGVFAMLAFQGFQAAGMAVGIMPVTGVPFPLLSYGGSSMIATCLALGLVLGVGSQNPRILDFSI